MTEIGVYEAKTHFARVLERVEKGEPIVITRHGRPVARLVAVEARDEASIRDTLARLKAGREALARRGVRLAELAAPGTGPRGLAHKGHRY